MPGADVLVRGNRWRTDGLAHKWCAWRAVASGTAVRLARKWCAWRADAPSVEMRPVRAREASRGLKRPRHFVRIDLEAGLGADDSAYAMG